MARARNERADFQRLAHAADLQRSADYWTSVRAPPGYSPAADRRPLALPPNAEAATSVPGGLEVPHRLWLPLLPAGRLCRTPESLAAAQRAAARLQDEAASSLARARAGESPGLCSAHAALEVGELERARPTNCFSLGWDHQADGYSASPAESLQADAARVWVRALATAIRERYGGFPAPGWITVDPAKGKGAPVPGNGVELTLAMAAWGTHAGDVLDGELERYHPALAVGPHPGRRWIAKQITRRQPRVKASDLVTVGADGQLVVEGEVANVWAKIRQAWMLPFALNVRLQALTDAWQSLIGAEAETNPHGWAATFKHRPDTLATLARNPKAVVATDWTKFDLQLHTAAVREALYAFADLLPPEYRAATREAIDRLVGLPIVGTGHTLGTATIYAAAAPRRRGLESGLGVTTLAGSLLAWVARRTAQYGVPSARVALGLARAFLADRPPWGRESIQSDDILAETFADTSDFGLPAKLEDAAVFLKRVKRAPSSPVLEPLMATTAVALVIEEGGGAGRYIPAQADATLPTVDGASGATNAVALLGALEARALNMTRPTRHSLGHRVYDLAIASLLQDPELDRAWGRVVLGPGGGPSAGLTVLLMGARAQPDLGAAQWRRLAERAALRLPREARSAGRVRVLLAARDALNYVGQPVAAAPLTVMAEEAMLAIDGATLLSSGRPQGRVRARLPDGTIGVVDATLLGGGSTPLSLSAIINHFGATAARDVSATVDVRWDERLIGASHGAPPAAWAAAPELLNRHQPNNRSDAT